MTFYNANLPARKCIFLCFLFTCGLLDAKGQRGQPVSFLQLRKPSKVEWGASILKLEKDLKAFERDLRFCVEKDDPIELDENIIFPVLGEIRNELLSKLMCAEVMTDLEKSQIPQQQLKNLYLLLEAARQKMEKKCQENLSLNTLYMSYDKLVLPYLVQMKNLLVCLPSSTCPEKPLTGLPYRLDLPYSSTRNSSDEDNNLDNIVTAKGSRGIVSRIDGPDGSVSVLKTIFLKGQKKCHKLVVPSRLIEATTEVRLMQLLRESNSRNTVPFLDAWWKSPSSLRIETHSKNNPFGSLCIQMAFAEGGDLFEAIFREDDGNHKSSRHPVLSSLATVLELLKGIKQGIEEIHTLGYAHLDIKEENILLLAKSNADNLGLGSLSFQPVVADMGAAERVTFALLRDPMKVTRCYRCPEIHRCFYDHETYPYNPFEADWYSFVMVSLHVLSRFLDVQPVSGYERRSFLRSFHPRGEPEKDPVHLKNYQAHENEWIALFENKPSPENKPSEAPTNSDEESNNIKSSFNLLLPQGLIGSILSLGFLNQNKKRKESPENTREAFLSSFYETWDQEALFIQKRVLQKLQQNDDELVREFSPLFWTLFQATRPVCKLAQNFSRKMLVDMFLDQLEIRVSTPNSSLEPGSAA